jgi:hypothetical protein
MKIAASAVILSNLADFQMNLLLTNNLSMRHHHASVIAAALIVLCCMGIAQPTPARAGAQPRYFEDCLTTSMQVVDEYR